MKKDALVIKDKPRLEERVSVGRARLLHVWWERDRMAWAWPFVAMLACTGLLKSIFVWLQS